MTAPLTQSTYIMRFRGPFLPSRLGSLEEHYYSDLLIIPTVIASPSAALRINSAKQSLLSIKRLLQPCAPRNDDYNTNAAYRQLKLAVVRQAHHERGKCSRLAVRPEPVEGCEWDVFKQNWYKTLPYHWSPIAGTLLPELFQENPIDKTRAQPMSRANGWLSGVGYLPSVVWKSEALAPVPLPKGVAPRREAARVSPPQNPPVSQLSWHIPL